MTPVLVGDGGRLSGLYSVSFSALSCKTMTLASSSTTKISLMMPGIDQNDVK
jgi:hypothetical protein